MSSTGAPCRSSTCSRGAGRSGCAPWRSSSSCRSARCTASSSTSPRRTSSSAPPTATGTSSHRLFEITGRHLDRIQLPRLVAALRREDRRGDARDGERLRAQRRGRHLHRQGARQRGHAARRADRLARAALLRRRRQGDAGDERGRAGAHLARPARSRSPPARSPTMPRSAASSTRIRERGYSLDNEEVVMGVSLRRHADPRPERPPGRARSASPGRRRRRPARNSMRCVEMLVPACGHVSRKLGYTGPWPPVESAIVRGAAAAEGRLRQGRDRRCASRG